MILQSSWSGHRRSAANRSPVAGTPRPGPEPPARRAGPRPSRAGVTLVEMLIVVAIMGLLAGITFPAVSAGVDTLRLNEATGRIVSLFNDALTRADAREQAVEITVLPSQAALVLRSTDAGFERRVELPQGVSIVRVLPGAEESPEVPRHFLIYPGGSIPRIGIEIVNSRQTHRVVRIDPITGVARVAAPEAN